MTDTQTRTLIHDPDVQILASLALGLQGEYINPETDPWAGSPFAWIKTRPSRQVGKIGEQLIAGWCASRELNVIRSPDSDADRIIEGKRIEVKFSTLWAKGDYLFQQIRDQNYEFLICLGVSPFAAHAWIFSKTELLRSVIGNPAHSQHRGRQGSDTYWLRVKPAQLSGLFASQAGTLAHVFRTLNGQ